MGKCRSGKYEVLSKQGINMLNIQKNDTDGQSSDRE